MPADNLHAVSNYHSFHKKENTPVKELIPVRLISRYQVTFRAVERRKANWKQYTIQCKFCDKAKTAHAGKPIA